MKCYIPWILSIQLKLKLIYFGGELRIGQMLKIGKLWSFLLKIDNKIECMRARLDDDLNWAFLMYTYSIHTAHTVHRRTTQIWYFFFTISHCHVRFWGNFLKWVMNFIHIFFFSSLLCHPKRIIRWVKMYRTCHFNFHRS